MKTMHDDDAEKNHARVGPLRAGADGQDLPRSDERVQPPLPRGQNDDVVCEHGTAMDVHCCNCHSGFLFDVEACVCEFDEIPRRARVDRFTPAERAIYDAVQAVEALPADVRLTDAVVLLQAARDSVADYVDGINRRRVVSEGPALGE